MLSALQKRDDIEKIFIMPDKIPPHKSADSLVSDIDRLNMCRLVAEDFSKAEVCDIEFKREGKSYTYDTVKLLKQAFPKENFAFVCGGDMLVYFDKWYKADELMKMLPFFVFSRVTTDSKEFYDCISRYEKKGMKIFLVDDEISNISSTSFRESKLNSLLPEKVYSYIKERGLYGV